MKRHALFVGVNNYNDKSIRKLRYSIPDASVLADRFKGLGYKTKLLADPTGAELKTAVEESVEGLGEGDVFLFFFAGHGFTAQDGSHLLFCRDDIQRLLRVNGAGVRVDVLEELTKNGGFHRAFLLDSCRTDCFAGMELRGVGTMRDLDFVTVPKCTEKSGSFFLLRSCNKFRPSLEFEAIGHGLFTQGLLDAMDARDGRLARCDTSFATAIGAKMEDIQRIYNVDVPQRPSIGECSGPTFSLFESGFLGRADEERRSDPIPQPDSDSRAKKDSRPKPTPAPEPAPSASEAVLPRRVIDLYKHLLFKCEASPLVKAMNSVGEVNEDDDAEWRVTDVPAFVQLIKSMPDFCKTAKQHKAEDRRVELECWFRNNWNTLENAHDADVLKVLRVIWDSIIDKKARRIRK